MLKKYSIIALFCLFCVFLYWVTKTPQKSTQQETVENIDSSKVIPDTIIVTDDTLYLSTPDSLNLIITQDTTFHVPSLICYDTTKRYVEDIIFPLIYEISEIDSVMLDSVFKKHKIEYHKKPNVFIGYRP